MSKPKQKFKYAVYSHFTDSFITDLYDSIPELKSAMEDGEYDQEVETELENGIVCKIEELTNYEVLTRATVKEKTNE